MIFWKKYTKIKDLGSQSKINNYLNRIEPRVKEINFKDKEGCNTIIKRQKNLKQKLIEKPYIFEIIEEINKLYIFIDNNEELLSKIDKLILFRRIIY